MATNGIATRADANAIVPGAYTTDTKRCVTYSSVNATGLFKITPSYSGKYTTDTNRLVLTSELTKQPKGRILFKINDYSINNSAPVISINIKGLKVKYPGSVITTVMKTISIPEISFTKGEIVLPTISLGNYTFDTSNATVTFFLRDGGSFEGTCDFTPNN